MKFLVRRKDLYQSPEKDSRPPLWIRGVLMITCTLVSFFHGSNDGQKGMGLMMLILVGLVPAAFAVNMASDPALQATVTDMRDLAGTLAPMARGAHVRMDDAIDELTRFAKEGGTPDDTTYASIALTSQTIADKLDQIPSMDTIKREDRVELRTEIYLVADTLNKLIHGKEILATDTMEIADPTDSPDKRLADPATIKSLKRDKAELDKVVKYIPNWVKFAVAIALGLGTMIGWKRIVVTVGEKIGKSHLTYAQGARAELMAAATIGNGRFHGLAREHDPRALLGDRRQHGGQQIGPAEGHADQHPDGLGAHAAGLHLPGRDAFLDRALHDAPRLRRPVVASEHRGRGTAFASVRRKHWQSQWHPAGRRCQQARATRRLARLPSKLQPGNDLRFPPQLHRRRLPLRNVLDFKELPAREDERAGRKVGWDTLEAVLIVPHIGVIEATGGAESDLRYWQAPSEVPENSDWP